MAGKVIVGITRDRFDKEGKFIFSDEGMKMLEGIPGVEIKRFPEYTPEITPEQIRGVDMVICGLSKWTSKTIAGNDRLLCIHRCGVGYDMVDVPVMTKANVMLTITPNAVRRSISMVIMTFLLALSTRLMLKQKLAREGRWAEREQYDGYGLVGRTLGSIGVGNIGHDLFKLAKPFEMKHIACDPYIEESAVADVDVKLVDMNTLLAESDFVSISCPLNRSTRGLVGEKELRKMKKTAYLINTARGPIVDEAALTRALKEGWIQGAAIDVFEQEPTPNDNPLLKMDNIIVTPHALGHLDQTRSTMIRELTEQISSVIRNEIPVLSPNKEVWNKPGFQAKLKKLQAAMK
jgi:phosphoglycerate dehydrogenase-like enzyme